MNKQQPEALRLAEMLTADEWPGSVTLVSYARECVAELRRQHARIAELEEQIEAIGAGGVTGPLIGQPRAMPDLSNLTERGAKAWAWVDAQGLRDGGASLSANAGEPRNAIDRDALIDAIAQGLHGTCHCTRVWEAWRVGTMSQDDFEPIDESETPTEIADAVLALLAAPPTAQAEGWTTLPGQMPEPGNPVLLDIGKKFPIRALWAEKHTVRVGTDVDDWGEYDEETDEYYCPEGWYEWNEHEEVHWAVSETPRAWRELPQPIPAAPGPADGESNG